MPWVKSFDEETAVGKAMQVFWEKGFDSASINDLIAETGVNRGSLYNAFGGKQPLFVKALLKYDQDNRQAKFAQLEALDDPRQAIGKLFDDSVASCVKDTEQKGCFLINTALDIGNHNAEVNKIVANGLREIEGFLRRSIEVGQARGDIRKQLEPQATAKSLLAQLVAIRVLGRGAYAQEALQTIADQAKQLIT